MRVRALEIAVALVAQVAPAEQTQYLLLTAWGALVAYAETAAEAGRLSDLTPELIGAWTRALTKEGKEPSQRTSVGRRYAARRFFEALRLAGVSCGDPTLDMEA